MARKRETNKREAKKPASELLIDPRRGDIEADASSTKSQSMLAIAGSMLVEISLPKLIFAWALLLVVSGLLLGLVPIVVAEWVTTVTNKLAHVAIGLWSLLFLAGIVALGWFGWRTVFRMAETNFWSLNSIVVQPGYAGFRELIRHILEKLLPKDADPQLRANLRAAAAAVAGVVVCALALLVLRLAWPYMHLYGSIAELKFWTQVGLVALANSVVVRAQLFTRNAQMISATPSIKSRMPNTKGTASAALSGELSSRTPMIVLMTPKMNEPMPPPANPPMMPIMPITSERTPR